MKNRYYIAYGSNLNLSQMKMRCPNAKVVGKGYLNDYELLFKGSKTGAYLTIEKKKGGKVPIGIWKVSKNDELNLDRYEGYPIFYYKNFIDIKMKDKEITAFIYIMREDREYGVPSDYYVDVCCDGYDAFSFDKRYLINAVKRTKARFCKEILDKSVKK